MNDYSYDPNGHANSALFTYVEGTFGFFAGKLAHTGDMKIDTPVATMGIRGTTGVMGQNHDPAGNYNYWQALYDDPGSTVHGAWDDFLHNPDGTLYVATTVSQTDFMTVFTPQGPGLPPLISTLPLPASYDQIAQLLIEDLAEIIKELSVLPHSLPGGGSPENPIEILPPEYLPELPGNLPQFIFYVPFEVPGGPIVIEPYYQTPPPTTTTTTTTTPTTIFIWPSGNGVWDTPPGWTPGTVPDVPIDTVIIESGTVQYGSGGNDNYTVNSLTIDAPGTLDVISGTLDVESSLDDAGTLVVGNGDPPVLTVSGSVTVETGAKLVARGSGAVIDLTVATVDNFGTIAARRGGYIEFVGDASVTNEASGKIKSVGSGFGVDFTGVGFYNFGLVVAEDRGLISFVDSTISNESGGSIIAKDRGSIIFSAAGLGTIVDNSGLIRATDGGEIKFEDSVTNETGGRIESVGCESLIVFKGGDLDNSNIVAARDGGRLEFKDETVVNETAGTIKAIGFCSTAVLAADLVGNFGLILAQYGGTVLAADSKIVNSSLGAIEAATCGTVVFCDSRVVNEHGGTIAATEYGTVVFDDAQVANRHDATIEASGYGSVRFDYSEIANEHHSTIVAADRGTVIFDDSCVTNSGGSTIAADRGTVKLEYSFVANDGGGTIEATHGGLVTFDGATVTNDAGALIVANGECAIVDIADATVHNNGGTIEAEHGGLVVVDGGKINNTDGGADDGIVAAHGDGSTVRLDDGADIVGGTLTIDGRSLLDIELGVGGPGATLDDVTVTVSAHGNIEIGATSASGAILSLDDGTTISGGTLTIENSGSELHIEASTGATLDGVTVIDDGGTIKIDPGKATLILDDGTTISGGAIVIGASGTLDVEAGDNGCGALLDDVDITDKGAIVLGELASGATLTLDDGTTIAGNGTLTVNANAAVAVVGGTVTIDTAISNGGELNVSDAILDVGGVVTGAGAVMIGADGSADFSAAFNEDVVFSGAGTLELTQDYSGTITGFGSGDAVDLANLDYVAGAYAVWNAGILAVYDDATTETIKISGSYTADNFAVVDDNGTMEVVYATTDRTHGTAEWSAASWSEGLPTGTSDAVLDRSSSYTVSLSGDDVSVNSLTISDPHATLDGNGEVSAADTITNDGTVDANINGKTLTLDAGAGLSNDGTLEASHGGTLEVATAVTSGSGGSAHIEGGTLEFEAASDANVTFDNSHGYGELVLGDAKEFTGQISGFAGTDTTGTPSLATTDEIDLLGIKKANVSFSEHDGNAVITIDQGATHTTITIDNFNYLNLEKASDGNGGTIIYDPPPSASSAGTAAIGGVGNDTFVFHPGEGAQTVADFNPQQETLELDHFANAQTVQELQSLITTDRHGDAAINLGHGDGVTLAGVAVPQLQQAIQAGHVLLH